VKTMRLQSERPSTRRTEDKVEGCENNALSTRSVKPSMLTRVERIQKAGLP